MKCVIVVCSLFLFSFLPKSKNVKPTKNLKADTYVIDIEKSKIFWACKGIGKQHNGYLTVQSGTLLIDTKTITSGFVYINMKSIVDLDIKDAGFNKNLVDHLKSKDFFAAATYPTSTFKILKTERLDVAEGKPNYKVYGELTIKNVKKPIEFMSTVKYIRKSVQISGDITYNRTIWNITYNSGNFFQDLGDKLINDDVHLQLDILAELK